MVAAIAALVVATRVFVAFDAERAKLVETPRSPEGGIVQVQTSAFPHVARLAAPFAVILRITTPLAGRFAVVADGRLICEPLLRVGTSRVDCVVTGPWTAGEHEVTVQGSAGQWTVDFLELATHHGGSTGFNRLFILPAGSRSYGAPPWPWSIAVFVIVLTLCLRPPRESSRRWIRLGHRGVAAIVIVLWLAVLASPIVSNYRAILSCGTFIRWSVLLFLPWVWNGMGWLGRLDRPSRLPRVLARSALVGTLVLGMFGAVAADRLRSFGGNYSGFLLMSRAVFDANPLMAGRGDIRRSVILVDNEGYDGQFFYYAIFDPLVRTYRDQPSTYRQVVDLPAYRYARLGFSLLVRFLSGGRWQSYPATMVGVILGALLVLGLLLSWLAQSNGVSPLAGALIVFIPGFWTSLQVGLPEPLAAATLLAAILALSLNRPLFAAVLFAISLLIRETALVALVCVLAGRLASDRRREALVIGAVALAPVLLWRLYVGSIFFPDSGWNAFFYRPPAGEPLAGIVMLWRTIAGGTYVQTAPAMVSAATMFPLLLIGGLIVAVCTAWTSPGAISVAAVFYAIGAVSLALESVWINAGNAQRLTFEMFVLLAVSVASANTYPRWVRSMLLVFWTAAAAYTFWGATDADFIRSAALGALFVS